MALIGWSELIIILSILFLIVPILIVYCIYYFIKRAARKGVKEALEEKVPSLQVTTRICPQCGRGVADEAKFCPNCGKQLIAETKRTN